MSPMRCPDCEKNVALEIEEVEWTDYSFDGESSVEVEIHMLFACAQCGTTLAEYSDTCTAEIPGFVEYVEDHEDLDPGSAEMDEPETEGKIITRGGHKTYLAKWQSKIKLGRKTFKVSGELAVTHYQVERANA